MIRYVCGGRGGTPDQAHSFLLYTVRTVLAMKKGGSER